MGCGISSNVLSSSTNVDKGSFDARTPSVDAALRQIPNGVEPAQTQRSTVSTISTILRAENDPAALFPKATAQLALALYVSPLRYACVMPALCLRYALMC